MSLLPPMMVNLGGQELLEEEYDENFEPTKEGEVLANQVMVVLWLCIGRQGDKDGGHSWPRGSRGSFRWATRFSASATLPKLSFTRYC